MTLMLRGARHREAQGTAEDGKDWLASWYGGQNRVGRCAGGSGGGEGGAGPVTDFDFFILLAVAFIGLEVVASFGVLDDNEESSPAAGDG